MRWVAASACVALALVTSGCDPQDRAYVRHGIGATLYTPELAAATQDQNAYVSYICEQTVCTSAAELVQAGMNDIDRRCDAYLSWLDARRRDREPILSQINAIGSTTNAIMAVTGVGVVPLGIVAQAFGLVTQTYSNWNSRLLMEVDHSTVQTVVYTRQTDFRNKIATEAVPDRARAIYLLRNYLRICLPLTIETDINMSARLAQLGVASVRNIPVVRTAVVPAPLTAREAIRAPTRQPGTVIPQYAALLVSYNPDVHRKSYVERIQRALCVPSTEVGSVGTFTRPLIDIYERADEGEATVDGKLDAREIARILSRAGPKVPCGTNGVKNYYERITYTDAARVAGLVMLLNRSPAGGTLGPITSLEQARNKIRQVRASLAPQVGLPNEMSDQMTRDLFEALFALQ